MNRLVRITRLAAIVVLLAPALWTRDLTAVVALLAIGGLWFVAELVDLPGGWASIAIESLALGALCGATLPTTTAVLATLVVPPFTAGVRRGSRGSGFSLAVELAAAVVAALLVGDRMSGTEVRALTTWAFAAVGFAMIAAFLHSALRRDPDPLTPYHDARELIRQLIRVSDGLSSGLDPTTLATTLLDAVRDELPTTALVLYVPRGPDLTPLVSTAQAPAVTEVALNCWTGREPVLDGPAFAFPLTADDSVVAVVAGRFSERVDPTGIGLADRVRELGRRLGPSAVRLDTALLFAELRDRAAATERRRLAREMHDGLAQDIASLGYLTDALAATPSSPEQAARIDALRRSITAVVAEVRSSVVTLRTGVGEAASLGAALGTVARNLTESFGVPVHVTLDERETRLRPEIEAELFRIAQQAMSNAVRHAGATAIHVHCRVRPPGAVITVADDGRGLQPARPDSQGLDIMRERATLIGARLDIAERHPHGTTVTVRLGTRATPAATREEAVTA
ncbi:MULTISPECIES: sensor histidine kinase [unclassified Nocardioides]|uniref:sensor histidine kinase n=1 Tax=Nocardioides sp. URHA0032 TaxID=1380388 RepID=UPI00048B3AF5|nr:sensor histidine kinase [Nocardioides sp. URHA0032]